MPESKKANINNPSSSKLGEIMITRQYITPQQLEEVLKIQKETGEKLGVILEKMGFANTRQVYQSLAEQLGALFVELDSYLIDPQVVSLLPEKFCRERQVIPVGEENGALILAMANPADVVAIDRARLMTGREIKPAIAPPSEIERIINTYFGGRKSIAEVLKEAEGKEGLSSEEESAEIEIGQLRALGEEAPIIQAVNMFILQAIRAGASDIHLEPQDREVRIRFRIDGILHDITSTSSRVHPALVSRIKILSRMNIAERRLPQDGRFQVKVDNRAVDFRVSSLPTIFGEKIVMRILDKSTLLLDLDRLGFEPDDLKEFTRLIQYPYGMVLLTGPTGSGKTTTLYSALNSISRPELNIITVEDPVEYQLSGINQTQVNPKIDFTFANALRSIMRQDPDIIMVGEIRDRETAEIAIHAALTGHLVLSTLHTNSAAGAIVRLQEMGVPSYLISSALLGVVAQRLVRKICPYCQTDLVVEGEDALKLSGGKEKKLLLHRGRGCNLCHKTGYRGREAVNELLVIDDDIRSLILKNATERELTTTAKEKGMSTLEENALRKVATGITTLEEMYRVVANF
ncbi:MAG TPA: type II secretion system ATPase GspE [Candidatus Atribacteria bacterium]|nr:type II secretion system ATPase GspE [Candidatus Atribacteria bacterium]